MFRSRCRAAGVRAAARARLGTGTENGASSPTDRMAQRARVGLTVVGPCPRSCVRLSVRFSAFLPADPSSSSQPSRALGPWAFQRLPTREPHRARSRLADSIYETYRTSTDAGGLATGL